MTGKSAQHNGCKWSHAKIYNVKFQNIGTKRKEVPKKSPNLQYILEPMSKFGKVKEYKINI